MLNAKNKKTDNSNKTEQPNLGVGSFPIRLAQVIDLGVQPQRPYKGKEKEPIQEFMLTYELTDVFMLDEEGNELEDKPRWLSESIPFYSLGAEGANSTKRYFAFDQNLEYDGDWSKLVGLPALLTVVAGEGKGKNAGKIYDNVGALSAMRDKDKKNVAELKNPPKVFDMDNPDLEVFKSLPDWVQDKIKSSLNFPKSDLDVMLNGEIKYTESDEKKDDSEEDNSW